MYIVYGYANWCGEYFKSFPTKKEAKEHLLKLAKAATVGHLKLFEEVV